MSLLKYIISGAQGYVYTEIYKALSKLREVVSLKEIGKGRIGVKEDFINSYLKKLSAEDKGIKSIRLSCKKDQASFFVEIKKLLARGTIEAPFSVDSFIFNNEVKEITFRFEDEKTFARDYYSRLLFWFSLSLVRAFHNKEDFLACSFEDGVPIVKNPDGTYTVDLTKFRGLEEIFERPYWRLIKIDGMRFDRGVVLLQLHKDMAEKINDLCNDACERITKVKERVSAASSLAMEKAMKVKEKMKGIWRDGGRE